MSAPQPFEIVRLDDRVICGDGSRTVVVMDGSAHVFRRRAIKVNGSGETGKLEALVAEIDKVRVYVTADSVIISREDLQL